MFRLLILLLAFISPSPAPTRPVINTAPPAFETPQSRLRDRDVSDEANLPTPQDIKQAADATEALIRDEIHRTDNSLSTMRVENRPLQGGWDIGGDLNIKGWYASTDLRKAEIVSGGEVWLQRTELYFAKGTLIARRVHRENTFGAYGSRYEVIQNRGTNEDIYLSPTEFSEEVQGELKLVADKLGQHVLTSP
jgi:hypothetical protein